MSTATTPLRPVIVDDTDAAITYTGSWTADKGTLDSSGNFGAPYLSTSHTTNSTASFSYKFSGTKVLVTGSLQFSNPTGTTSWQCSVDGTAIPSIAYSVPQNNLDLCDIGNLTDGPHTLDVKVAVTAGQTFWMDYIKYVPSASVALDTAAVEFDPSDPALLFDAGWSQFTPGFQTGKTGSKLSFSFNGASIIYYGFYDASLPFDSTTHTASYAIDGQTPIPFNVLPGQTSSPGTQFNQVLFNTGPLTAGPHLLEVTFLGTPQTTPLTFEFIVVQNGTAANNPVTTSTTTTSAVTSNTPSLPTSPGTSTIFTTVDPSPTDSSPATTTTSGALPIYQTNVVSMMALMTFVIYFLSGRSIRSY